MIVKKTILLALLVLICGISLWWVLRTDLPHKTSFIFLGGLGTERELTAGSAAESALQTALTSLKNTQIVPILSSNLGYAEYKYATSKGAKGLMNEDTYIRDAVRLASTTPTPLWLHIRANLNHLSNTAASRPLTAEEILTDSARREAFLARARTQISLYAGASAPYESACTVVLFEDDSPYASEDQGGRFWLGSAFTSTRAEASMDGEWRMAFAPANRTNDMLFVDRFTELYTLLHLEVKKINPSCRIGIFPSLNASMRTLDTQPLVSHIFDRLTSATYPDILMVRSFSKSYTTQAEYEKVTRSRIEKMRVTLPSQTNIHLIGQIHTTNEQGKGAGRTPSLLQLEGTLALAKSLPLSGFGYLGKDWHESAPVQMEEVTTDGKKIEACVYDHTSGIRMINDACTFIEDSNPFAPNTKSHNALFETDTIYGLQRWDKALELLTEF
jgi:hypothetical protein